MHRVIIVCLFATLFFQASCTQTVPSNSKATAETENLYKNLQRLQQKGTMFGHQDDLAYGIGWQYEEGRSDVKEVVGQYPAVVGWDLGHLELGKTANLDDVPFDRMREYAQDVYNMGGLNTFSWHLNNPLDPTKTSWDKVDSTIYRLFNNPVALQRYDSWLDKLATFMKSLQGPKGEAIPVVFRPLHEHTGNWFWWGRGNVSAEEYKRLWRYTVDYLRKQKVNNVLYAYSTDRFTSKEDYLEFYPGDKYVDIVGFDIYHRPPQDSTQPDNFVPQTRQMVETLRTIGQEKNKVWTLSETGLETLPQADWWTNTLYPIIKDAGLSYVLVWRNGRPDHYYAPYVGQKSAEDFKEFVQRPDVLLMDDVAKENIYQPFKKQ
ncbi:mannan endo-1,4-beta-mannosidase [Pontibacter ummariensis]|uniref:Mannan endo-1,4-beta-mannosidase n=1 Tax=Pontibacter ummariensis TaxID=1610492 RepID=A0A239ICL5_9BACT|nr:glycosyl hydrolase [Pontibacter ummariensis]PRY09941.1 mannan endo-1,4-beta-mannosidase [Pontibacter ummariensis]SNS91008.1 mannan endo-1,4-beta-mannosidase [Pontibacter ummariensis]